MSNVPQSLPVDYAPRESSPSRAVYWIAVATAIATFPLILMGGEVTSRGAGLSVPDWPNSFGYNMFAFPISKWIGGIFYEHSHRLIGTVVGMLAIALVIATWITDKRRWVRWLSVGVLGAVIFQGVLGGLRVVWVNLDLAIVHACFAQATFCLMGLMIAATSRWWQQLPYHPEKTIAPAQHAPISHTLIWLTATAVTLIYLQTIAGAVMRHYQAGLAIPDLPLAYGHLIPPTDPASLQRINAERVLDGLPAVTAGQIWMHFAHRVGAVLVTVAVLALVFYILKKYHDVDLLRRPAKLLLNLLVVQFTLGVLTVLRRREFEITSLHVAFGAVTLFAAFYLGVRELRLRGAEPAGQRATEQVPSSTPSGKPITA